MEKSETSTSAKVVSFISISFIVVSTIGMTLNTIPDVYLVDDKGVQTGRYIPRIFLMIFILSFEGGCMVGI